VTSRGSVRRQISMKFRTGRDIDEKLWANFGSDTFRSVIDPTVHGDQIIFY